MAEPGQNLGAAERMAQLREQIAAKHKKLKPGQDSSVAVLDAPPLQLPSQEEPGEARADILDSAKEEAYRKANDLGQQAHNALYLRKDVISARDLLEQAQRSLPPLGIGRTENELANEFRLNADRLNLEIARVKQELEQPQKEIWNRQKVEQAYKEVQNACDFAEYHLNMREPDLDEAERGLRDAKSLIPPLAEIDASADGTDSNLRDSAMQIIRDLESRIARQRRTREEMDQVIPVDKANLGELRKKYVKAKKNFDDHSQVKSLLRISDKKEKVQAELFKMQEEYEKALAEYIGLDTQRFVEERTKLLDDRLKVYAESRGMTGDKLNKLYEGYKSLGKYNVYGAIEGTRLDNKVTKFVASKVLNLRTGISFGLLGVGLVSGATTAVGIGALSLRRGLSAAAAGFGSYDIMNMATSHLDRKAIEKQLQNLDADFQSSSSESLGLVIGSLETSLAKLESEAILSGKTPEVLRADKLYQELLAKRNQVLAAEFELKKSPGSSPQSAGELAAGFSRIFEERSGDILRSKKAARTGKKIAAGVIGATAGLGTWALGKLTGAEAAQDVPGTGSSAEKVPLNYETKAVIPDSTPPGPAPDVPESVITPPVEKTPEVADIQDLRAGAKVSYLDNGSAVISAGKRGIEGSILDYAEDLRTNDQAGFEKLVKALGASADDHESLGRAAHRLVLDYAKENNLDPTKLDKILRGELILSPDGKLAMGSMPDFAGYGAKAAAAAPAETIPVSETPAEAVLADSPLPVEEEGLVPDNSGVGMKIAAVSGLTLARSARREKAPADQSKASSSSVSEGKGGSDRIITESKAEPVSEEQISEETPHPERYEVATEIKMGVLDAKQFQEFLDTILKVS